MGVRRFDVHLVSLDPTVGTEIQKTRPCLVISPDEVILDQIRTVDRAHLVKRLGKLRPQASTRVLGVLQEMFAS